MQKFFREVIRKMLTNAQSNIVEDLILTCDLHALVAVSGSSPAGVIANLEQAAELLEDRQKARCQIKIKEMEKLIR